MQEDMVIIPQPRAIGCRSGEPQQQLFKAHAAPTEFVVVSIRFMDNFNNNYYNVHSAKVQRCAHPGATDPRGEGPHHRGLEETTQQSLKDPL